MAEEQERLKLLVIIVSTRPQRAGLPIGEWIAGVARDDPSWDIEVADLKEIDLPMMNEPKHPRLRDYQHDHTKRWSELVEAQDAFIFVIPEYNHSYIAPIKNALDYLTQEWGYKPVGLVSYGGLSGGLRAAQLLKEPIIALKMMPLSESVAIPMVAEHIDGRQFVPYDSATSSANVMLTQLRRWALALKPMRTGQI